MTVETEVANLTTAVDNLTTAVNVSKATLDASVADSESARDQSQDARDTAEDHKLAAEAAATSATNTAAALTGFDLDAIAASKAVTAVDVFVYDASRDSDGGAWRKRTQGTSWYNETLNTATRGARREFPAVAVIVAEAAKVTIYDGDDPALPMWMVFNAGTDYFIFASPSLSSVFMLNGVLCVGDASFDLYVAGFVSDKMQRYLDSSTTTWSGNIVNRNSAMTAISVSGGIVNRTVNDVAMTVLPNAPIDPATGLQVPTIAVATAGGVSVIKDDGTVVDSASTSAFKNVNFDAENTLYYGQATFNLALIRSTSYESDGFSGTTFFGGTGLGSLETAPILIGGDTEKSSYAFAKNREFLGGGNTASGFTRLGFARYFLGTTQMTAFATSTYNTGWMNGDIKGAFLSDTDDTDLVGGDADPGFASYVLHGTGTFSDTGSGVYQFVDTVGGQVRSGVAHPSALTTNKPYVLTLVVDAIAGAAQIRIDGLDASDRLVGVGTHTIFFTSNGGTPRFRIEDVATTSGDGFTLSSASFDLADADRSVNNKGLIVNGTVTRSPVATGADLVAYSDFSSSNYLEQPYNSALDFGTGDFCVMGWVYNEGTGSTQYLFSRGNTGGDWRGIAVIRLTASGTQYLEFYIGVGSSITTTSALPVGWTLFTVKREGGVAKVLFGNTLVASGNNTNSVGTGEGLKLGGQYGGSGSFTAGSLALLRISATAPTAEQIEKIYNDEKFLFQENAQATLYGASDAVTALAFDDTTQMLHVGTSAGRSVFSGLRRVSNTTTAVGTAISASNGLVVEE